MDQSVFCALYVPVPVPEPRHGAEERWSLTPHPALKSQLRFIPPHVIAGAEGAVTGMCGDTAQCQRRAGPLQSDPRPRHRHTALTSVHS